VEKETSQKGFRSPPLLKCKKGEAPRAQNRKRKNTEVKLKDGKGPGERTETWMKQIASQFIM